MDLYNYGSFPFTISGYTFGVFPDNIRGDETRLQFSAEGLTGQTINPGETLQFTIHFTPFNLILENTAFVCSLTVKNTGYPAFTIPFTAQVDINAAIDDDTILPTKYSLLPVYPNPFNGEAVIRYTLAKPAEVRLTVYDITGRVVRALRNGRQDRGAYSAHWNGRNQQGVSVAGGVYFIRMQAGEYVKTVKAVYLK